MPLSSGILSCNLVHLHKILICNSYTIDLYLSWCIEIWDRLKFQENIEVAFVDVSTSSFDQQIKFQAKIKRFFMRQNKLKNLIAWNYLPVKPHQNYFSVRKIFFRYCIEGIKFLQTIPFLLRCKDKDQFLLLPKVDPSCLRSAHSTLAGKLGTVEYSPRRHALIIFLYLVSFMVIKGIINEIVTEHKYCQVVVGNGRLLNSAAILSGLNKNVSRLILERGSKPGKLDSYTTSAHSMKERRSHVEYAWSSIPTQLAETIAIEYLELRRICDPISGIKWNENQRSGLLPEFESEKNICVFYTSTELEFAVFFDEPKETEFTTQKEALLSLIETLDPQQWIIYVRRHPYSKSVKNDPEGKNWSGLSKFTNVRIIDPDSKVDSYELGTRADLVAHFNSSIGPELIFLQNCPVITMGDNSWERLDSPYLLRNKIAVKNFLTNPLRNRPKNDAYKWAYYSATFGENFQIVEWQNFRAFIDSKHILARKRRQKRRSY